MELKDKIAGALYGMALGDAMGMPAELWGRERARKFFGGKINLKLWVKVKEDWRNREGLLRNFGYSQSDFDQ